MCSTGFPSRHAFGRGCGLFALVLAGALNAAPLRTGNVFFITTDGMRSREIFEGAEEALLLKENCGDSQANADTLRRDFCPPGSTPEQRRKLLLPFLTGFMEQGQAFGNRAKGGDAHITNTRGVSYPGYNELLTGAADPRIVGNEKISNPNISVLEWMNHRPAFAGKVAAYGSWDVFPYILNQPHASFPIKAGWAMVDGEDAEHAAMLPVLRDVYRRWDSLVYDAITFRFAFDYLRANRPRLLYLGLGETDDWAHARRYDLYLRAAHQFDRYLRELWEFAQATPGYRDATTFVISTDHGRGSGPVDWKGHGVDRPGSSFIWVVVRGPDTAPLGERNDRSVGQNQVAATVAALLGEDYRAAFPAAGAPIAEVLPSPSAQP